MTARSKQPKRSVELVRVLYITGLTDFQNLLDMERIVFEQQDIQAASQGRISKNLIRLYKAMGGGWDNPPDQADLSSDNTPVEEQLEHKENSWNSRIFRQLARIITQKPDPVLQCY